jgi:hypothetical protein
MTAATNAHVRSKRIESPVLPGGVAHVAPRYLQIIRN